jgi:hypothetical protein
VDTDELRKAAKAVYLATEATVAEDLSNRLKGAADEIDALRKEKPRETYMELEAKLHALPDTWYPDVLRALVEHIATRKVFKTGGLMSMVERTWYKALGVKGTTVDVCRCARCGENHTTSFQMLARPVKEYGYWGRCVNTGEPILMAVVDDGKEPDG